MASECNCARRYDPDQFDHEAQCSTVRPAALTPPVAGGEFVMVPREDLLKARNTAWLSHVYWLRAAKEALQGDVGKLRKHVAIAEGVTRETVIEQMSAALYPDRGE